MSNRRIPRKDSLDDWPFESCYWCGVRNNIGFEVDNEVWERVVGDPDIVLCPACFDTEAQKKGVPYQVNHHVFVTWDMD